MLRSVLVFALVPGCVERDVSALTVDGKDDAEAARIASTAACERVERCGYVEVECPACPLEGPCGECSVELTDVTFAECSTATEPNFARGFGCEELTAAEISEVDACLEALPNLPCTERDDVVAWLDGREGEDPRNAPPECALLEDIYSRCAPPGEE